MHACTHAFSMRHLNISAATQTSQNCLCLCILTGCTLLGGSPPPPPPTRSLCPRSNRSDGLYEIEDGWFICMLILCIISWMMLFISSVCVHTCARERETHKMCGVGACIFLPSVHPLLILHPGPPSLLSPFCPLLLPLSRPIPAASTGGSGSIFMCQTVTSSVSDAVCP